MSKVGKSRWPLSDDDNNDEMNASYLEIYTFGLCLAISPFVRHRRKHFWYNLNISYRLSLVKTQFVADCELQKCENRLSRSLAVVIRKLCWTKCETTVSFDNSLIDKIHSRINHVLLFAGICINIDIIFLFSSSPFPFNFITSQFNVALGVYDVP